MPIYKTGKTKDGKAQYRVVVHYTDPNGAHRQTSKRVYGAAEAKMEELRLLATVEEKPRPTSMTIQQLHDEYLAVKKSEVRQSSHEKMASILRLHILPYLGRVKLDDLSMKILQEWKTAIAEQDTKVTTKNNAFRELRSLLNYAVKLGYLAENPTKRLGNFKDPYFTHREETLHYYTPEQFHRFIEVAEQHRHESFNCHAYYVFFNIAFYTGLRKGEINALKWSDIEGDRLHVRRSLSMKTKGGPQETPPKNKSSYRTLQMPQKLVFILEQHRMLQSQIKGFSTDFRVCGGPSPLHDTGIEQKNTRYAKEADLPHIRIHDYRHSHASLLANEGINIQEIARRLGHANVQQTWNTYSHLYPREEERAVQVLESV